MKTNQPNRLLWPLLAASLIAAPLFAQSPERPDGPPRHDNPPAAREEAPNPERIKHVVREMAELHKAGKHEEARKLTQRLREIAKDNPEAARQVFEALREQRQQAAKPDAPKDAPRPRQDRPAGPPQADQPPMNPPVPQNVRPRHEGRPQAQQGQSPAPRVRPNAPQRPMPMARPNVPQGPQAGAPGQPQRPNVAVATLRHLKAAAGHLAAAGYPDYAAKAREEAGRIESALKQHMPQQPQRPMIQSRELRQDRPAIPRPEAARDKAPKAPKAAKEPGRKQDDTSPLLRELQKLNKQMGDLNNRVRKLEKEADDD